MTTQAMLATWSGELFRYDSSVTETIVLEQKSGSRCPRVFIANHQALAGQLLNQLSSSTPAVVA